MTADQMIKELRNLYEQHKDDTYSTFTTRWSEVCYDCANKIEELNNEIIRLKTKYE